MRGRSVLLAVTRVTGLVRGRGSVSVGWDGTDLGVTSATSCWAVPVTVTAPRRSSACAGLGGQECSVTSRCVLLAVRDPAPGQASVGVAPAGGETSARSAVPGLAVFTVTAPIPETVTVARGGGARCVTSRTVEVTVTQSTGTAASRASVSAGWAGRERGVRSVSPTPAVSMEPVVSPGTATARRAGQDPGVTRWRRNSLVTESGTVAVGPPASLSA